MREGDKSIGFFHKVANSNRRNNLIDSLIVDGYISLNSKEIREHILQFYTRLYSEQFSWRPKLDGLLFNSIDVEEATWLERDFEESEVFEVLKALNQGKAPKPFSLAFFQVCWEVLRVYVMNVFHEFHACKKLKGASMPLLMPLFPRRHGW
jgi:hypothetical protein